MQELDLCLQEKYLTIVGDSNITDIVDKHFIKTLRSEGALDDIGNSLNSGN